MSDLAQRRRVFLERLLKSPALRDRDRSFVESLFAGWPARLSAVGAPAEVAGGHRSEGEAPLRGGPKCLGNH